MRSGSGVLARGGARECVHARRARLCSGGGIEGASAEESTDIEGSASCVGLANTNSNPAASTTRQQPSQSLWPQSDAPPAIGVRGSTLVLSFEQQAPSLSSSASSGGQHDRVASVVKTPHKHRCADQPLGTSSAGSTSARISARIVRVSRVMGEAR